MKDNFRDSCGVRMPRRLLVLVNEYPPSSFPVRVRHVWPTQAREADSQPCGIRRAQNRIQPSINVFVLYDNDLGRERAGQTKAHLIESLGESIDVRFSWSSLKLLYFPSIRQLATEELRACDIVLFSISSGGDLPLTAKAWIAGELAKCSRYRCRLLALVELGAGAGILRQPSPPHSFLSAVARSTGMDFVSQSPSGGTSRERNH